MSVFEDLRKLTFDDFDPQDYAEPGYYDECRGTFYQARRAGDRDTGAPRYDALYILRMIRERYLLTKAIKAVRDSGKESYLRSCEAFAAGDTLAADAAFALFDDAERRVHAHLTKHRTLDPQECYGAYKSFCRKAFRPVLIELSVAESFASAKAPTLAELWDIGGAA